MPGKPKDERDDRDRYGRNNAAFEQPAIVVDQDDERPLAPAARRSLDATGDDQR